MGDRDYGNSGNLHRVTRYGDRERVSSPYCRGLATSYDESTWVLTSYLVAKAVVLPLSAWLSRVFGRKNYYMTCVALFSVSSLTTDYRSEQWARAIQRFGIAFLFVPTSQLAYSYLPKNKNNKASSLTNLFRNQDGSFGIAFVTTMVERRSQLHHSVLALTSRTTTKAFGQRWQVSQTYVCTADIRQPMRLSEP